METKSYFDTYDKSLCCGCRACEQTCKKNAISMVSDSDGFIYPEINKDLCVECNACRKVCPVSRNDEKKAIKKIYELQNKDEDALKKSSSGGVFISLARYVLSIEGVVFGTVFNENNEAVFVSADTLSGLERMQGSKYVFSDTKKAYSEAEAYLKEGRTVLFTGTPCQVAGLKCFLKKDYENLITMDFLCHGVPSPKAFDENVKYLSQKYKGEISDYKFRDKSLKGWGIVASFMVNGKRCYEPGNLNEYFFGFIKGFFNRYSCYNCHFRGENRYSDITVGDFWGCTDDKLNIRKGISFAAVNTVTGETVFEKVKQDFIYKETSVESVSKENATLIISEKEDIPEIRSTIYEKINTDGYKTVAKKHLTMKKRFMYKAKLWLDLMKRCAQKRK